MSAVGLGSPTFGGDRPPDLRSGIWGRIGLEEARPIFDAAIAEGVTFFDLADIHAAGRAEMIFGELLKARRHEVVIGTKWGSDVRSNRRDIAHGSRRYIRIAVEASLRRLQTDYIDLYQLHFPDPRTPLEETLAALDEIVREGKVRYIGHSHFTGWQLAEADWIARTSGSQRFISAQNRYNVLEREAEAELIPACARFGVGLIPYFPLGKSLLTGRYGPAKPPPEELHLGGRVIRGPVDDSVYRMLGGLDAFAKERGMTMAELAIAFLAAEPMVAAVVTGASNPEQIRANARAIDRDLGPDDMGALRKLLETPTTVH